MKMHAKGNNWQINVIINVLWEFGPILSHNTSTSFTNHNIASYWLSTVGISDHENYWLYYINFRSCIVIFANILCSYFPA